MKAEIIAVGTELLLGQILNTNAQFLSERLAQLGIDVFFHTTVGDNKHRIIEAFEIAARRADLIITTGGLGPTDDDLTREALAAFIGIEMHICPQEIERIKEIFKKRNSEWVESNKKQASYFPGSSFLKNEHGTAPGLALKHNNCTFLLLPGPTYEMRAMFDTYAVQWLKDNYLSPEHTCLYSEVFCFMGISESKLEALLLDLFRQQHDPTLALLAKTGEIHLRLTTRARDRKEFLEKTAKVRDEIIKRAGKYIIASGERTINGEIAELLVRQQKTISTAESCTGGLLSGSITSLPGSSNYYRGSVIAYANETKSRILKVPPEMLHTYGAVSEEVALAMARGVRELTITDISLAITGVAGPGGGSPHKPVGLVYLALDAADRCTAKRCFFSGDRETIRQRSVKAALHLLLEYLRERKE